MSLTLLIQHRCTLRSTLALASILFGLAAPSAAQEKAVEEDPITQQHLEELESYRDALVDYEDNEFLLEEKKAEYLQAVSELPGTKIEFTAAVVRVRRDRVVLQHCQWGRTRIVLLHYSEKGTPTFGSLSLPSIGSVPPTTYRYARHAATPMLEMGLEISEKLAKTLRAGDLVQLSGYIEHTDSRLFRGNSPDTLVYVANIQSRKYYTPEELDLLDDQAQAAKEVKAAEATK